MNAAAKASDVCGLDCGFEPGDSEKWSLGNNLQVDVTGPNKGCVYICVCLFMNLYGSMCLGCGRWIYKRQDDMWDSNLNSQWWKKKEREKRIALLKVWDYYVNLIVPCQVGRYLSFP